MLVGTCVLASVQSCLSNVQFKRLTAQKVIDLSSQSSHGRTIVLMYNILLIIGICRSIHTELYKIVF